MDLRCDATDQLFHAILQLETPEDCYRFFEDLCTIRELRDLSQRYQIAQLLSQGLNYQTIVKQTEASTTTISRVNQCLNYGTGGYREAIRRQKGAQE